MITERSHIPHSNLYYILIAIGTYIHFLDYSPTLIFKPNSSRKSSHQGLNSFWTSLSLRTARHWESSARDDAASPSVSRFSTNSILIRRGILLVSRRYACIYLSIGLARVPCHTQKHPECNCTTLHNHELANRTVSFTR